jgi:hypothetical protein
MSIRALGLWLWVGFAGLLGGVLPGCGGEGAPGAPPSASTDRTSWQGVFRQALAALEARSYDDLHALLTPVGKQALEADLQLFGRMLADPEQGPRLMAKIRARWPEVPAPLVERARAGDLRAGWDLFMTAATPTGVAPQQGGLKVDPGRPDEATVLYRYGEGPEQPVVLRRVKGLWAVEYVGLGAR